MNLTNSDEIKYGIYHIPKGRLLTWEAHSNEGHSFCNEETVELTTYQSSDVWLVADPLHAEWVRCFNTEWYNSSYDTPRNPFSTLDTKVIKVRIKKEYEEVSPEIPTVYEIYKSKYAERNPSHWESIKNELPSQYGLWDLSEYYRKDKTTDKTE